MYVVWLSYGSIPNAAMSVYKQACDNEVCLEN
jgi:hypothetical protein